MTSTLIVPRFQAWKQRLPRHFCRPRPHMHELAKLWASDFEHIHYIPVLSNPKESDLIGNDNESFRTGYVHEAIAKDFPNDLARFDIYASGPPAMVEASKIVFELNRLPAEQYFSDAFEFQQQKKP